MFISSAYAQTAPAAAAAGGASDLLSLSGPLPLFAVMFAVMYFIMIRPQMRKQKETKAMLEAVAKGDEVVTAGGILGKISKVGDNFLSLEVSNGVEIQIQRSAVIQVLPKGSIKQ